MNTWKRPQLTPQEKEQLKKYINTQERKQKLEQQYRNKAITRTSINNKINRQIDYVMIRQRFRNCVRKAQTIPGRKANTQQEKTQRNNYADMYQTSEKLQGNPNLKPAQK